MAKILKVDGGISEEVIHYNYDIVYSLESGKLLLSHSTGEINNFATFTLRNNSKLKNVTILGNAVICTVQEFKRWQDCLASK